MNVSELQIIINDLDAAQAFVPLEMDEGKSIRDSLVRASEILTWLADEVVEAIPHRNLIR